MSNVVAAVMGVEKKFVTTPFASVCTTHAPGPLVPPADGLAVHAWMLLNGLPPTGAKAASSAAVGRRAGVAPLALHI
jgi:hypothetical protein